MEQLSAAWQRLRAWWLAWGAWALVLVLAALFLADLSRVWQITNHHDLDVFLRAARRLRSGENIFAELAPFKAAVESGSFSMKDDTVAWPYAYSPLIAILFLPATWLPEQAVQMMWWGVGVASLVASAWLALRLAGRPGPGWLALGLLVLYRFEPAVVSLRLGQIELLQLLLLAVALDRLERNRDRAAGIALGIATALKFFPGALVALLVWRRRWRAALWTIAVAGLLVVGSFAVVGFDAIAAYMEFTSIYGIGGAFAGFPLNQSINGLVSRNLIENVFSPTLKGVSVPALAKALVIGADVVVVAASAWLTWRDGSGDAGRPLRLEYSLALAALALVSPHSQVYTYVWLLIPLLVLARQSAANRQRAALVWAALIGVYLLIGRDYALYRPGLTRIVQAHYVFGALLLWLAAAGQLLWARRSAPSLSVADACSLAGGAAKGETV